MTTKPRARRPRRTRDEAERYAAHLVLDLGKTHKQAMARAGLDSEQTVKTSVAREEGRREILALQQLSLTKQQAALLARERLFFNQLVVDEVSRRIGDIWLPSEKQRIAEMEDALANQSKAPLTNAEYRTLLAALHPDSSVERRTEAFHIVTDKALRLRGLDQAAPRVLSALPTTVEELLARSRRRA
jgi:hypothetical protein